ncbi:unnamed protein product [Adineta steineri]|uniref:G-protein coupled receptors family 1 profile domain-containing protein n=1 Tax=Adineta steineri TaxID=433720 RepID=A0A814BBR7_9BILA|nr:unnamed protein product [Adineta steineri]CAF3562207.1 unnamed protein product [Adineta steineri]
MHANVSFDAVAADEDTTPILVNHDSDLIVPAFQRHSNTILAISYYWPALFLLFFSIIGILGNLLVCLAIVTERRLQNRTNWFLFSLALADMLISGFVIPLAVVKEFTGYWILGPVLCDFWIFLDVCSSTSSIMHIVVISLDRYLAINDPLNTRNRQQKCKILLLIILIWTIAILLSSPMIVLGAINRNNIIVNGQCLINNKFFVIYGSVVSFVIPLIIVIITYVLTVRLLKEQIRQCQTQIAQEQLARAASFVTKPFLRRHMATGNSTTAASVSSFQSTTPASAAALRRMRLIRQATSFELSEESVDNISLQQQKVQQQQQQEQQHSSQFDQESQIEEKPAISRNTLQSGSTKFSPHTEYACPKNPFCQLKCTCNHYPEQQQRYIQLETVLEPKARFDYFKYIRCCKRINTTPSLQSYPSFRSHPLNLPISTAPNRSSISSNPSLSGNIATKYRRRLTNTPSIGMSRPKSSAIRNEQKAVKVLGVVFVIFVIAWFPFCIINLLQGVCKRCFVNPNILNGSVWLGYVSSTINPLVYTIFNRNFRLKFIALLKCQCLFPNLQQRRQFLSYQSQSSIRGSRFQRKNDLIQKDIRQYRE